MTPTIHSSSISNAIIEVISQNSQHISSTYFKNSLRSLMCPDPPKKPEIDGNKWVSGVVFVMTTWSVVQHKNLGNYCGVSIGKLN